MKIENEHDGACAEQQTTHCQSKDIGHTEHRQTRDAPAIGCRAAVGETLTTLDKFMEFLDGLHGWECSIRLVVHRM